MSCTVGCRGSLEERMERKIERVPFMSCWVWTGALNPGGYGQIKEGGRVQNAHRLFYQLSGHHIPDGYEVDHLCRNRWCVNPAHLEAVSKFTNFIRGNSPAARNARKTHCPRGHPLILGNLTGPKSSPSARGRCKTCRMVPYVNYR